MIALVPPLEPELLTGPVIEQMIAYRLPRAAIFAPIGFETETDLVIAFAPTPLPAPAALRDRGAGAVAEALSGRALNPFVAPAPPAQPRVAASELTEDALALERAGRIDVQRRLALAGFDPSGTDGAFGPRTRSAIADFQTAWGFPATGYLEAGVYADLTQRTEDAYQALTRQAAAAPSAAPELAPIAHERRVASAEQEDRCARRSDGRIIERQSFACDLAGLGEQFVSLGRNTLNDGDGGEDDNTVEIAARTSVVLASGADR
jgi:peptidoglycan hydrolase-like protein with peptidoglycan-binding domain